MKMNSKMKKIKNRSKKIMLIIMKMISITKMMKMMMMRKDLYSSKT